MDWRDLKEEDDLKGAQMTELYDMEVITGRDSKGNPIVHTKSYVRATLIAKALKEKEMWNLGYRKTLEPLGRNSSGLYAVVWERHYEPISTGKEETPLRSEEDDGGWY